MEVKKMRDVSELAEYATLPVIIQDLRTKNVLYLELTNGESLRKTIDNGILTICRKFGAYPALSFESYSKNGVKVSEILSNDPLDVLLYKVVPVSDAISANGKYFTGDSLALNKSIKKFT
jgi:hypothetical protein